MKNKYLSREINIGNLSLGGNHPVRIQSMTNTSTLDTQATVEQILRLEKAGCELVRVTATGMREAENLKTIRQKIREKGCHIPLVADVHFHPKVAEIAATTMEKVRINPGNYSGSHHKGKQYSDTDYQNELKETARNLRPLLKICRQHHTALRIGINHGSLSDRILFRYGNTPEGMVAAAMEFIRICEENRFYNLTLSLKASNVATMITANRLMMKEMKKSGRIYPLHLGVTEAGNGIAGRVKSAMGIGTLLAEGIGDTIRVSLTEKPENEIPVARQLIRIYGRKSTEKTMTGQTVEYAELEKNLQKQVVWTKENFRPTAHDKILLLSYRDVSFEELTVRAAVDFFRSYARQKAKGLLIISKPVSENNKAVSDLAMEILQAAGIRYSKTEFVACPSCGRTRFDIEKELEKVKRRLGNLKGVKIAVMGCFVNGPGEMADADYGFVGAAAGKVNLYQGSKIIYRNLPEEEALEKLEKRIRENEN
jgi:(E)-4-hydroxy-3-methylbut-2-enyl-diphosphate synthase